MSDLLPLFVNLAGRRVLLVGGGPVAASKLSQLLAAGADVRVVAPEIHRDILGRAGQVGQVGTVRIEHRGFVQADVNDAWLVVAAATPEVNRSVAAAAEARHVFVNAVDDPGNASAFLGGVVRRGGVTVAISTSGDAPGLTALLRQALDALLPREVGDWVREARRQRAVWRQNAVPMEKRRPLLLEALNKLYDISYVASGYVASGFSRTGQPDDAPVRVSLVGAGPGDPGLLTRHGRGPATMPREGSRVTVRRARRRARRAPGAARAAVLCRQARGPSRAHPKRDSRGHDSRGAARTPRRPAEGRRSVRVRPRRGRSAMALAGAGVPFEGWCPV